MTANLYSVYQSLFPEWTVMNALSAALWRAIRSRNNCVSSTLEIRRSARAAESSESEARCNLFDDLGNQVQTLFDLGCD